MTRRFVFIGVTTGASSMVRIFPRWRQVLALDPTVELVGRDLPIHAPPAQYRELVAGLKDDPATVGALITTHKIDLYEAARALFDGVDDYARLLGEVSCLASRHGRLLGWATDPLAAGRSLEQMLHPGYFGQTGAEVLCFGAGGAGNAITAYLLTHSNPDDRPRRIVVTDPDAGRLRKLEALHRLLDSGVRIECIRTGDPLVCDRLMASVPEYSLVINATGMGKDRPGSPVSAAGRFPLNGIAWELNYRGELGFLHGAWAQRRERRLRVEDGWSYFLFGWTSVIEVVFQRPITPDELARLTLEAESDRPAFPTSAPRTETDTESP